MPRVERKLPDRRLTTVVLPDPLGPTSPTSSPVEIVRVKRSRARTPPKFRDSSTHSTIGVASRDAGTPAPSGPVASPRSDPADASSAGCTTNCAG